jgi:hypothetical protein
LEMGSTRGRVSEEIGRGGGVMRDLDSASFRAGEEDRGGGA